MKIEFTKEQFEILLKVTYFGNWMANAHRTEEQIKKYEEMEDYIFSFAKQFGFDKYVDDEESEKRKFYPTRIFEEETDIQELIEEYDKETFWDELINRLGERDFYKKYGIEKIKKMNRDERFKKLNECINDWIDEINQYGIDRLKIVKD
ncbi:MAG: hypothetical protein M1501_04035 [Candidatus Omnitrophica bacterium]|nr:hypothetical protein [Candidatus Omnitrophota bacterium]